MNGFVLKLDMLGSEWIVAPLRYSNQPVVISLLNQILLYGKYDDVIIMKSNSVSIFQINDFVFSRTIKVPRQIVYHKMAPLL